MLKLATAIGGLAIAVYFTRKYIENSPRNAVDFIGSLVGISIALYFIKAFIAGRVCLSNKKLHDKTVIITGGNIGIGKETAIDLAKRGARVIIACRSMDRGGKALQEIREESGSENVHLKQIDLASLKSVRLFAKEINTTEPRLDILINNAGVMACPYWKTEDGFEMQFGTNHLGHFLLTNLLLELLKKSAPSRIITVSSLGHFLARKLYFEDLNSEMWYNPWMAYAQSKLANIMFTNELNKRLQGSDVSCFSLHPGVVHTNLGQHSVDAGVMKYLTWPGKFFHKNAKQGAQTSIYCAVQEGLENNSGKYFSDCAIKNPSSQALDDEAAKKLWLLSEEMVGLTN